MSIRTEGHILFEGTPTTDPERKILRDAGFVHVTGLHYTNPLHNDHEMYYIGENLRPEEHGHWCSNNGLTVVVTTGGEVWLKAGYISEESQVITEFCPNGNGAFVPLSNGEQAHQFGLLMRISDPNYNLVLPASTS